MLTWQEFVADIYQAPNEHTYDTIWDLECGLFVGSEDYPTKRGASGNLKQIADHISNNSPEYTADIELANYTFDYLFTRCAPKEARYYADGETVYKVKDADISTYIPSEKSNLLLESISTDPRKTIISQDTLHTEISKGNIIPLVKIS